MNNLIKGINLYLIGMMGAGKTTVGKLLATQLSYRFFDLDDLIERVAKQSINDIFAKEGEVAFRQLESQVLSHLSADTRSVISTGGGIVMRRENWSYLHHGLIVWLDVPLEVLSARLQNDLTRPLLKNPDPATQLKKLLEERQPLYAQADLHVPIAAEEKPEQVVGRVIEAIPQVLKPAVNSH